MLRRIVPFILCLYLLAGCTTTQVPVETTQALSETTPTTEPTQASTMETTVALGFDPYKMIDSMSLETLVGQLFLGSCPGKYAAIDDISAYQPGGFVLFGSDFKEETPNTLRQTLQSYQDASPIPMLFAVDEEGGVVCRISCYPQYRSSRFPAYRQLFAEGGQQAVLIAEEEKSKLLSSLGIHINLGPVCDITTEPSAFMYQRSLGQSPEVTGQVISAVLDTMASNGIGTVLKHFPGYGNNVDTHIGTAQDNRSLEELEATDLVPFRYGIDAGCDAIMVSHTVITALDDTTPASLSPTVHQYLREQMGFQGIIMTDDLIMDAISDTYGDDEAAVLAILAGNDILCTGAFQKQYPAVLEAVQSGRIPLDTVKESVARILTWKYDLGLIEEKQEP